MSALQWLAANVPALVGVTLALVVVTLAVVALRAPRLVRLGLRNAGRRPLRSALIVLGLTLGALVLGGALFTGDALTHTVRSLVAGSLGTVDEVVVRNPPRNRLRQQAQAILQPGFGGLASAGLEFFPEAEAARLADAGSPAVAAAVPAIVDSVTVIQTSSQQLRGAVALLAIQPDLSPDDWQALGPLVSADDTPIDLARLGPDQIVVNAAAAEALGIAAGAELTITRGELTWPVTVAAVSGNGGLSGTQPLVVVPLERYQAVVGQAGQINLILIANQGGVAGVARSDEAARDLRWALADRAVAAQLKPILARPEVQRGLEALEARTDGRERERLQALRAGVLQPQLTPEVVSLMTDPRIRARLQFAARRLGGGPGDASPAELLGTVADLSVLPIKQETLDQASEYGAVITTVFLVLGIFSVIAAVLLIGLIFALLAADRGAELATLRAIGMRRPQIMQLFVWEGVAYSLAGAALGTLLSVAAGYGIVWALGEALIGFGIRIQPTIEPRSLGLAFAGGLLLALGAIWVAAWRVCRAAIVAATRGELVDETGRWQPVAGALLLGVAGAGWYWLIQASAGAPGALVMPILLSLALVGAALLLLALPPLQATHGNPTTRRWLGVVVGGALVMLWLRLLLQLPRLGLATDQGGIAVAVAGSALSIALIWTAAQALGPLLWLADVLLREAPRWRAVLRPAGGYLGHRRGRAALTMVLFGMVIFVMVTALTVVDVLVRAYGGSEPPIAGFDLRSTRAEGSPITDIGAALAEAPAIGPDAFRAVGSVATAEVTAVQLGLATAQWQDLALAVVDDGFVGGIAASLQSRVAAYGSDRAAWAALAAEPGTAIVTGRRPPGFVLPTASVDGIQEPAVVWVRSDSRAPVRLRVIAVVDSRSQLDPALYVSDSTAAALEGAVPAPDTFFFAVRPGVRGVDAAQGLQVSFAAQGLTTVSLDETARIIQAVRLLLVQLVQGFLGLGLLAGVAALGLLGVQSVLERRQQLGTLRALGFTSGQVRATLVIESALIALFGIGAGTVAGLVVARSLIAVLAGRALELSFAVPWTQIGITVGGAWLGAALAIVVAAHQAGRVAPAEALRAS